jgi:hypothetical protein
MPITGGFDPVVFQASQFQTPGDPTPNVSLNKTRTIPGLTVTATVINGPANTGDWVALFTTAAGDGVYVQRQYLNGSPTIPPAVGLLGGVLNFTLPALGFYNVRFFSAANVKLATSATIEVAAAPEPSDVAVAGMRSGLFRSGSLPLDQWLLVRVAGALVDPILHPIEKGSITVTDNQNETQDSCSFLMWGDPPQTGAEIVIAIGTFAKRLFGGAIQTVTQLPMKPGNPECWRVTCVDWWHYANRRRVYAKYLTLSADTILKDIISRFTSGFTWNHVLPAPNITGGIEFGGDTFSSAVSQICARVGWDAYIDAHRDFHFFDLETTTARALEPGRYHYRDLSFTEDIAQIRNRVFQQAGGGVTTAQVLAGALSIPIDVTTWYPTVGPNMRVQHGGQIIPYTAVAGGALTIPAGAITHVIPQGEEISLFVQVDDVASQARMAAIEGGDSDGIHEFTASADRRLSEDGAINKAQAELDAYNTASLSGSYTAFDDEARSGRIVPILLPYRGRPLRDKRFGITSVTSRIVAKRRVERTINFGSTEKLDIFTALRKVQ